MKPQCIHVICAVKRASSCPYSFASGPAVSRLCPAKFFKARSNKCSSSTLNPSPSQGSIRQRLQSISVGFLDFRPCFRLSQSAQQQSHLQEWKRRYLRCWRMDVSRMPIGTVTHTITPVHDNTHFLHTKFVCQWHRKLLGVLVYVHSEQSCWQATVRRMKNLRASEWAVGPVVTTFEGSKTFKNQRTVMRPFWIFSSLFPGSQMRQFEGKVHKSEPKGLSQEPWGIVPHCHGPKDSSNHPSKSSPVWWEDALRHLPMAGLESILLWMGRAPI